MARYNSFSEDLFFFFLPFSFSHAVSSVFDSLLLKRDSGLVFVLFLKQHFVCVDVAFPATSLVVLQLKVYI